MVIIIQSLSRLGPIVFEKNPTLRFRTDFSARQLSPPEFKMAEQNWCMRHTFDVLDIYTKFHLADMHGSSDIETAYFAHMLTL